MQQTIRHVRLPLPEGAREVSAPETNTSAITPLLLNDQQAAEMLGIGTSYFRRLIADGTIGPAPVALGKRRLHRRDLLEKWVSMGLPNRTSTTWKQATGKIPGSMADSALLIEMSADPVSAADREEVEE